MKQNDFICIRGENDFASSHDVPSSHAEVATESCDLVQFYGDKRATLPDCFHHRQFLEETRAPILIVLIPKTFFQNVERCRPHESKFKK